MQGCNPIPGFVPTAESLYFGVFYDNILYYLPCNVNSPVIKHELLKNSHRTIPSTYIPNVHDSRATMIHGLRIGKYFWIFGGNIPLSKIELFKIQYETSLWSIERELWISGPKLPEIIGTNLSTICVTALNSTTVMFIGMGSQNLITYNFQNDIWKYSPVIAKWTIKASTCSTIHDKKANM